MKNKMRTYQGTMPKEEVLEQLAEHARLDQIVQGRYWERSGPSSLFRGCAVGCLTHDPDGGHFMFPELFGLPVWFALLIDSVFEGLAVEDARLWPMRVMSAVPEGVVVDDSVRDLLAVRRLRELVLPLQDFWSEEVRGLVVEAVDGVVLALETGEGLSAARSAAWAAESATESAQSAESSAARSAAWAAESATAKQSAGASAAWAAESDLIIEVLEGLNP